MTPVIRIRIDFAENVHVGPGKIALLEAIKSTGSISDAARSLGMSYRRAWMLINSLKQGFSEAVTISATGGAGGGVKSGPTAHPARTAKAGTVTDAVGHKMPNAAKSLARPRGRQRCRPNSPTLLPPLIHP